MLRWRLPEMDGNACLTIDMLKIEEYSGDIKPIMPLLLLGDESYEMISRYIHAGRIFAGYVDNEATAVCVVIEDSDNWIEIKNLAVATKMQRQGIGRAMLAYAESKYPGKSVRLGTGETPSTLRFYESCGYKYSHRIADFFIDNYEHPIIEEGVRLKDMLYLVKDNTSADDRL